VLLRVASWAKNLSLEVYGIPMFFRSGRKLAFASFSQGQPVSNSAVGQISDDY
jgi:hypothetical protein